MTVQDDLLKHEAIFWNAHTRGNKRAVDELMTRITKRRGKAAADKLLAEMRKQWKLKSV